MESILEKAQKWTKAPYDAQTQNEIKKLIADNNMEELEDRFYKHLEFGTAGLRGIMAAGDNRMNIYNIKKVTQGLANYIIKKGFANRGVVIGRDSRINSDLFANATASIFLANNIPVFFFKEIHPTPMVAYGIVETKAISGVMITSSHNPKIYNGYKVFWEFGGQIISPDDKNIIEEVQKITSFDMVKELDIDITDHDLFTYLDDMIDSRYLNELEKYLSIHPEVCKNSNVGITYSPLYGTGFKIIPQILQKHGFTNIHMVTEQSTPDGNFPTAPFPNPELEETMKLPMETAQKNKDDIVIASDPDADRIGVSVRAKDGKYVLLNGNQIASILIYYILSERTATHTMPDDPFIVSTLVTSRLLSAIASQYNCEYFDTFTGFKWIGKTAREHQKEGKKFLFGCEESHGYNGFEKIGDKDAVGSSMLMAEACAFYKNLGKNLLDVLENIYKTFGHYEEEMVALVFPGEKGVEMMHSIMENIRKNPPLNIGDFSLTKMWDLESRKYELFPSLETGENHDFESDNIIGLYFSQNVRIMIRPSGTEPKIKFYISSRQDIDNNKSIEEIMKINKEKTHCFRDLFLQNFHLEEFYKK